MYLDFSVWVRFFESLHNRYDRKFFCVDLVMSLFLLSIGGVIMGGTSASVGVSVVKGFFGFFRGLESARLD